MALWHYVTMALWHYDTMTLWHYGTMSLWHYVTMTLWHYGTMTLWHYGTMLQAGTMEKLVESLASDTGELESTYINVFLATYRTFASPKQVLNLLTERLVIGGR